MLKRAGVRLGLLAAIGLTGSAAWAQQSEADAGFGLRGTLSVSAAGSNAPADGSTRVDGGARLMLYPTWKISSHWTVVGAYQAVARPYYLTDYETPGHGVRGNLTQGYLSYSKVWKDASLVAKAGELTSVFGAFPLRYDDRDNPMVGIPQQYGYYGAMATLGALAGAEVDGTWKRLDARAQFTNSSPANPRSIFAKEQYGNWAGGAGFTIRQGLRVGISGYRGPYVDRTYPFYFPAEGRPRSMPGNAIGLEVQWARGHWNTRGEWQKFEMTYGTFPTFHEHTGYGEVQRSLGPRWYVASRMGYVGADYAGRVESIEVVAGYRPGAHQIVKLSYETKFYNDGEPQENSVAIQFVTALPSLSFTRR